MNFKGIDMMLRTLVLMLLAVCSIDLARAADDTTLPSPTVPFTLPGPGPNTFGVSPTFGPGGLLYVWTGAAVLKQDAPLSSSFTSIGSVGSGSSDAGPIAFSSDGSRILVGNGFGGPLGGVHADQLFGVPASGGDSSTPVGNVPFHHSLVGAPLGGANSSLYFLNQGDSSFAGSSVSVFDETGGANQPLIENIPGPSTSMALSSGDRLFVGVGVGAQRGQIRSFALADLASAYNTAMPLDWAAGTVFNTLDNNSGAGMFFDSRGFLFVGGPNGVTVFDTNGEARLYDNSGFTSVVYDPASDLVLVTGFGAEQGIYPASLFQVPEPSALVLAAIAGVALIAVRRRKTRS